MCNCRDKKGFNLMMSQAVAFERQSKKEAAIFSIGETISFTDRANIGKVEGICCYFTTDNVEHKIVKAETVSKIEVTNSEEVKPKKKRRNQSKD